ncbi:unnamed protein product [Caenorhabditis angaria]|uniref:DUF38 domain-containing protein n=1 Tax=Caenorhabditis angaria TaxID=860376 RepID=A0A9P1J1X3_9PELO|nr:unnamed protein product [Caenorhabditis angaria]
MNHLGFLILTFVALVGGHLNNTEQFIEDLKKFGIPGALLLNSSSPNYEQNLMEVVDRNNGHLIKIIEACSDFLTRNLSASDALNIREYIDRQSKKYIILMPEFDDFNETYKKTIEKLLENTKDPMTISTIQICKNAPAFHRIASFRHFFRWFESKSLNIMTRCYKKQDFDEMVDIISQQLDHLYYFDRDNLEKHSGSLRKMCTSSSLNLLEDEHKKNVFWKLYENHYYRGAYEYAIYNTNVSEYNFFIIQKASIVCWQIEQFAPREMSQIEMQNNWINVQQIIRETIEETAELENKLDLQHLLDSTVKYVQWDGEKYTPFLEAFTHFCEKTAKEKVKITMFSVVEERSKIFKILTKTNCWNESAHLKLNDQIIRSASGLMQTLAPYCHYTLEKACYQKFGTETAAYDYFNRPFRSLPYRRYDYPQHAQQNPLEKLENLAKHLTLKN